MSKQYNIGDTFYSPALEFCFAKAAFDPDRREIVVDHRQLRPNPIKRDIIGTRDAVWHGATKVGYADVRSIDAARGKAIWQIVEAKRNPYSAGSSHSVSGLSSSWATYSYTAIRMNEDGSPHETGEVLSFNPTFYVENPQFVTLPLVEEKQSLREG